jgi:hypothetical protein
LRGALENKQLFTSDISAFYAQFVKNLALNNVLRFLLLSFV